MVTTEHAKSGPQKQESGPQRVGSQHVTTGAPNVRAHTIVSPDSMAQIALFVRAVGHGKEWHHVKSEGSLLEECALNSTH